MERSLLPFALKFSDTEPVPLAGEPAHENQTPSPPYRRTNPAQLLPLLVAIYCHLLVTTTYEQSWQNIEQRSNLVHPTGNYEHNADTRKSRFNPCSVHHFPKEMICQRGRVEPTLLPRLCRRPPKSEIRKKSEARTPPSFGLRASDSGIQLLRYATGAQVRLSPVPARLCSASGGCAEVLCDAPASLTSREFDDAVEAVVLRRGAGVFDRH
jgi:hypothetical protein